MRKILLACALLLAACGGGYDGPVEGRVVEHKYDDPDTWMYTIYSGKSMIPVTGHDEAHYYLVLDDGTKHGSYEVDEKTYHRVKDGDTFNTEAHHDA